MAFAIVEYTTTKVYENFCNEDLKLLLDGFKYISNFKQNSMKFYVFHNL